MAYGDFIDLRRRTGKLLRDKAFSVAKNWKCDEYQIRLMVMRNLWFTSFLIKRLWLMLLKNEVVPNKEFAEELHKPIIRKIVKMLGLLFLWKTKTIMLFKKCYISQVANQTKYG